MGPLEVTVGLRLVLSLGGKRRQHAPAYAHPGLQRHQDADAMNRASSARPSSFRLRLVVLFGLLLAAGVGLAGRAVQLQLLQHRFLASEGAARFTRVAAISAHRGTITDRYGEPLAVSTPVDSAWANPRGLARNTQQPQPLVRAVRPGRELHLSIDLRLQYLAYRELKAAIRDNRASSGSAVILDVRSGEVLAMVDQPAYNPNDRSQLSPAAYRNRAATDLFEPGSSIKPFFVAAALASGRFEADSIIDTSPGWVQVGTSFIQDEHPLGPIPLAKKGLMLEPGSNK